MDAFYKSVCELDDGMTEQEFEQLFGVSEEEMQEWSEEK